MRTLLWQRVNVLALAIAHGAITAPSIATAAVNARP